MHNVNHAKSTAAKRSKERYRRNAPQDELEVEVFADLRAVVGFADCHGEDGVGDHPRDDHVCAHGPVVVFLLLSLGETWNRNLEAIAEVAQGLIVAGVDVELLRRHFELDRVALAGDGGAKIGVDHVVAFGAPGDVVSVAEGIDL